MTRNELWAVLRAKRSHIKKWSTFHHDIKRIWGVLNSAESKWQVGKKE